MRDEYRGVLLREVCDSLGRVQKRECASVAELLVLSQAAEREKLLERHYARREAEAVEQPARGLHALLLLLLLLACSSEHLAIPTHRLVSRVRGECGDGGALRARTCRPADIRVCGGKATKCRTVQPRDPRIERSQHTRTVETVIVRML